MAIKNFKNTLKQNVLNVSPLKDPSLAFHADLIDIDDQNNKRILESIDEEDLIDARINYQNKDKLVKNWKQTENKPVTDSHFSSLTGLQRAILIFLYEECKKVQGRTTESLSREYIASSLGTSPGCIKMTALRLKKKDYIEDIHSKTGRGGWSKYTLSESTFREILQYETNNKLVTNWRQTDNKPVTSLPENSMNSTLPKNNFKLPIEWLEIDYSELKSLGVPFDQFHLKQWFDRGYCNAQEAQESIQHFTFTLKHSNKSDFKSGPLNFFMGIMAKSKYFGRPDNYISPQEKAQQKRLVQQKEELIRKQNQEEEFFNINFETFFYSLTAKQIKELSPHLFEPEVSKSIIKEKFRDKYWLEIRDSFRNNSKIDVETLKLEEDSLIGKNNENYKNSREIDNFKIQHEQEKIKEILDNQFGKLSS